MDWRLMLCAVDFSDPSRRALRLAAAIAGRLSASLVVATVDDPLLVEAASVGRTRAAVTSETLRELEQFVKNAIPEAPPWLHPRLMVRVGNPAEEILALGTELPADVIVVGTHGLRGYQKAVFGSTTERLLRSTRLPVLAVPPTGEDRARFDTPRPTLDMDAVVAPIDFGPTALADARAAADIAAAFDVPLVLLHVVETGRVPLAWREQVEPAVQGRMDEARRHLEELGAALGRHITIETVVRTGRPSDEIADVAVQRRAGFVVMGLRGRGGFLGARPGSVAYRVVSTAPVPVLALPPPAVAAQTTETVR